MAQAAKKPSTTPSAFLDPRKVPKTPYALRIAGSCMEPAIPHGSHVLIDPTQPVKSGDLAAFYLKKGIVSAAGTNLWLKRVVLNMMPGVKFPYKPHPDSNVMPIFLVEQDNPKRQYQVSADQILAVHKCLGLVPETTKLTPKKLGRRARQLEPAA